MKIKTINVLVTPEYGDTEIHSYLGDYEHVNESMSEAMETFRKCIEEVINASGMLRQLTEEEMTEAMEKGYWNNGIGTMVELEWSAE